MTYECPVCGYDELTKPPEDYTICPSCGTEFENDDFDRTHAGLRHDWISDNMPWFSRSTPAPKNWSPYRQLIIADHAADLMTHARFNDLDFRSEVNKAFSEVFISKQLKALRERKEDPLTQAQLAEKAGMKQSRISELEGMNYSSWSISTLERLAKALGVAFTYSFEAWRALMYRTQQGFSNEVLAVPSFEHDLVLTDFGLFIKQDTVAFKPTFERPVGTTYTSVPLSSFAEDTEVDDDELLSDSASSAFFQKTSGPESITSLAIN
jgi:transcriptional regulator with XRE-family HTH domain